MSLETLKLEHLPSNYSIHAGLFKNVKNAEFLQKQLLEGNTDFEYALIDASIVCPLSSLICAFYFDSSDKTHLQSNKYIPVSVN